MLARRNILLVVIMACLMTVFGCQSEEEAPVEQPSRPEVTPQPETTGRSEGTTEPKTAFQETIQNQLTELDKGIESLRAKAEQIPGESKEEFNQMMQSLQSQKEVVEERLEALKDTSAEGWETLKSSTEEAMSNLQKSYQDITNRFL
jgi:predicted RNase H-like nuclease (RuvC/YqgF family)